MANPEQSWWDELATLDAEPPRCGARTRQGAVPAARCPHPAEFRLTYTDAPSVDERSFVCSACLGPALRVVTRRCAMTVERMSAP